MRRATVDRVVRRLGGQGTVALRRRHSLLNPVAGTVPSTLLLDGPHLEGATAVTLRATSLAGVLVSALRLTIAGESYEVAAEVTAVGNRLVGVQLTRPLVASAADGDPVAVEPYRDYVFRRMYPSRVEHLADGTMVRSGDQELVLSAVGARTAPRSEDLLVIDGRPEDLESVRPIQPGDEPCGWVLRRGGRAA